MFHSRRDGRMRVALLVVLVAAGCGRRPAESDSLPREQIEQNLQAQAEEVGRAVVGADHERLADLTHPTLVRNLGGREKYVKRLGEIAAEMKGGGFRMVASRRPGRPRWPRRPASGSASSRPTST